MARSLPPRDTVAICESPHAAAIARMAGYHAVTVGSEECPDTDSLRQQWTRITCRNPSALVIGPPELAELVQALSFQTQVNNNTGTKRSRRWVEHLMRNVHHLAESPSALQLEGKLRGVPAFVVGAGPSLSRNAHLMREAAGKGIVITVNSASRAVRGQVVLTVESNPIMAKVEPRDSVRVYGLTCDPLMLTDGSGPFMPVWTGEIGWVCDKLTGMQRIAVSGSGSTAAVSLAHLWGCSPIVLVGQDLAYTDGRVYAPETGFPAAISADGAFRWDERSRSLPRPGNPLPEAEELTAVFGWGGGQVLSGPAFVNVIQWLASAGKECQEEGAELVNATEGGAAVPNWESRPLADVLAGLPQRVVSPGELRLMAGGPPLTHERLSEWLDGEAADDLLEPWAMPRVRELLERFRSRAPYRVPIVESMARRRFDRQLERVVSESRAELQRLCG